MSPRFSLTDFPPSPFFYTIKILKKYFSHLFVCLFFPFLVFYVCAESIIQENLSVNDTQDTLLDHTHKFVVKSMYGPVTWFDNFFSDERTLEEGPVTSSLIWRKELRWEKGKHYSLRTFLHANIRLPKASKKLKLIIRGDEEEKEADDLLSGELIEPGFIKGKDRERLNMGLRYNLIYTLASKLHFGSGIKLKRPLEPYVRARYRHITLITAAAQVRFTGTALWRNLKGWRKTAQFDFEKLFSKSMLIRWSNSITFEDPTIDYSWGTSLGFQHQMSKKYALSYNAAMSGITHTATEIMGYSVGIRFRSNFYRDWLFYEIAPETSWPRNELGKYNAVPAIIFRIEMQFR